ncbi:hypothetical protein CHS0354_005459, partial [Potamilus streckersoni]
MNRPLLLSREKEGYFSTGQNWPSDIPIEIGLNRNILDLFHRMLEKKPTTLE